MTTSNASPPQVPESDPGGRRHDLTLEVMSDVEASDVVSHRSVQAWVARVSAKRLAALGGSQPDLQVPSRRQQKT